MNNLPDLHSATGLPHSELHAAMAVPLAGADAIRKSLSSRHLVISWSSSGVVQLALIAGLAWAHGRAAGVAPRIIPAQPGWASPSAPADTSEAETRITESPDVRQPEMEAAAISLTTESAPNPLVAPAAVEPLAAAPPLVSAPTPDSPHGVPSTTISAPPNALMLSAPSPPLARAQTDRHATLDFRSIEIPSNRATTASQLNSGSRTETPPRAIFNPSPDYPAAALLARQEGRVVLKVRVNERGEVIATSVLRSCGIESLDHAALTAVRRWRFEPPRNASAVATSEFAVPIRFSLVGQ